MATIPVTKYKTCLYIYIYIPNCELLAEILNARILKENTQVEIYDDNVNHTFQVKHQISVSIKFLQVSHFADSMTNLKD